MENIIFSIQFHKKRIKRIFKKYGEWIIEIEENQLNISQNQKIITIKNIEDLYKISENLGKPILSYHNKNEYIYFVNEDTILYKFILSSEKDTQ